MFTISVYNTSWIYEIVDLEEANRILRSSMNKRRRFRAHMQRLHKCTPLTFVGRRQFKFLRFRSKSIFFFCGFNNTSIEEAFCYEYLYNFTRL